MPGQEEIAKCRRELLEAAAHMDPEIYRNWSVARICTLLGIESGSWQFMSSSRGSRPCEASTAENEFEYVDLPGLAGPKLSLQFRCYQAQRFSDEERLVLADLAAQACGAWRMAAQLALLRCQGRGRDAAALVDAEGRMHAVQGNLHEALRASWPLWQGGALPPQLCASMLQRERLQAGPYRWSVEKSGTLLRVSAELLGAAAFLTAREQAVAAAVLEYGSQKAAAARLGVSNHTVRNTLVRVYSKLGVGNRVELALRFRPAIIRHASVSSPQEVRVAGG